MLPDVKGAAAIEKASTINSEIATLCSHVRKLIDSASAKAEYISQKSEQWKATHSGRRWELFLKEVVIQLSKVLSLECRKHEEMPRTREVLRTPEHCSFAFFVEKIKLIIGQLSGIHLEIRRLLHLIAPNKNQHVATFNGYLYRRVQLLRNLIYAQRHWELDRGAKATIKPNWRLMALSKRNKKRLYRHCPLLFVFWGRRRVALKAFEDMR